MKAIIISEDTLVAEELNNILVKTDYDVIIYKWLLKAMDNLDEIKPDCILVNSSDYPRHWKILTQFIKTSDNSKHIPIILFNNCELNSEELRKANFLKIDGIINASEVDYENSLLNLLISFNSSVKNTIEFEEDFEDELFSVDMIMNNDEAKTVNNSGFYLLTNPKTGKFISGKSLEYDGHKITCHIKDINAFEGIEKDTNIQYFTYSNNDECKSFSAIVNDYLDLQNEKFIVLDICDFYEKN